MIDTDKVNSAIDELEENVDKIKKIGETVTVVKNIGEKISKQFEETKELNVSFDKSLNEFREIHERTDNFYDSFEEELDSMNKKIDNYNKVIKESLKEQDYVIEKHLQELRSENKQGLIDIENSLKSKIEKFESDLILELRDRTEKIQNEIQKRTRTNMLLILLNSILLAMIVYLIYIR